MNLTATPQRDDEMPLDSLSLERQRYFLERLLTTNPAAVKAELIRELKQHRAAPPENNPSLGTMALFADLAAQARLVADERARAIREDLDRQRREYVEDLVANESRLWNVATRLVATKNVKAYDTAISLIKALEDLAFHRQTEERFRDLASDLAARFPRLIGFRERMAIAGFIAGDLNPYQLSKRERWRKTNHDPIDLSILDQLEKSIPEA